MADSVVKIDRELEKRIEELIKKEKFLYSSKKQVVNLAVIEFLNSIHQERKFLNAVRNQRFLKSWKEKQNQSIKSKKALIKKTSKMRIFDIAQKSKKISDKRKNGR